MENAALWTRDLERFVKFRIKDRANNGAPLVLNNSQFVIDGVVMAINDHPERYRESFTALNNLLRSRFEALQNGARPMDSASMDLYLTWCLFDAVCKGTVVKEMLQLANDELPFLVISYMPLWGDYRNINCSHAAMDHGSWYWNMIRSWFCVSSNSLNSTVFTAKTLEACQHAVIQHFGEFNISKTLNSGPDNANSVNHIPYNTVIAGPSVPADAQLPDQALPIDNVSLAKVGAAAINRTLKDFKSFRGPRDSCICVYCGVSFSSEAARVEHREYHIGMVRQYSNTSEPTYYSRLLQPSVEDFTRYHASHADGKHTYVCARAGEMTKINNSKIHLRRDNNEIVKVEGPNEDRYCSVCYARFDVYQDTVSMKYALRGALNMRNADNTLSLVHESCIV